MTNRDLEFISLSRDTSEADLKQRREIGTGGTVFHVDQAVVTAAIQGRTTPRSPPSSVRCRQH